MDILGAGGERGHYSAYNVDLLTEQVEDAPAQNIVLPEYIS